MKNFDDALKTAIVNSDTDFLNSHRYNINHRFKDEDNDTLLMYAISDFRTDIYNFFLEKKADIKLVNDEGENIIHSIVYSGEPERLKAIVNKYDIDLNRKSLEGVTPLLLSVLLGKIEIFDLLLYYNANINLADNDGNTPLHVACSLGYLQIVKKLIALGVDFNKKTKKGNLPLALAVNNEHSDIVKFMVSKVY